LRNSLIFSAKFGIFEYLLFTSCLVRIINGTTQVGSKAGPFIKAQAGAQRDVEITDAYRHEAGPLSEGKGEGHGGITKDSKTLGPARCTGGYP